MKFEVICYRNGVETNHSPYFKTFRLAFDWLLANVKHNEDANICLTIASNDIVLVANHVRVSSKPIAHFHGMTQYA